MPIEYMKNKIPTKETHPEEFALFEAINKIDCSIETVYKEFKTVMDNKELQELLTIYYDNNLPRSDKLHSIFYTIETKISKNELYFVDDFLKLIDIDKQQPIIYVGILRCTSRLKNILPSWIILLDKVQEQLESENKDFNKILRGMI